MARRAAAVVYTFRPDFPTETIQRYPSLTLALGNNYPGMRTYEPGHHASNDFPDHDAPMPFDRTSSSISAPAMASEAYVVAITRPRAERMPPSTAASHLTADEIPSETTVPSHYNPAFFNNCIPICQGPSTDPTSALPFHPETVSDSLNNSSFGGPTGIYQGPAVFSTALSDLRISSGTITNDMASSGYDFIENFISIGQDPSVAVPKGRRFSVTSKYLPRSVPSVTSATAGYNNLKTAAGHSAKRPKLHKCPYCNKTFYRPCDVITHINTHTGEQPFPCAMPGCPRRFGVRSNMLRHNLIHGFPRTGHVRPITEYRVQFAPPQTGSLVHSDITMQPQVVWDEGGPFSKRQAHSSGSLKARRRYN